MRTITVVVSDKTRQSLLAIADHLGRSPEDLADAAIENTVIDYLRSDPELRAKVEAV